MYCSVLKVAFASTQFTGTESSGFIEVVVRITGGTSITPITVTVTPTEQSPVSAIGKLSTKQPIQLHYHCALFYLLLDVDFNSIPFNITINAGSTEGRGNVTVILDNVVEGLEKFNMSLTLASDHSQITLDRDRCEGQIIKLIVQVT